MKLREISNQWDADFFEAFQRVRREALRGFPEVLDETEGDLRDFFDPSRAFAREHEIKAWIAGVGGASARGAVFRPRAWGPQTPFIPLGFFEHEPGGEDAARVIVEAALAEARRSGAPELRAPIDGSFFGSYRLVEDSRGPVLFSEPRRPARYRALYAALGFEAYKHWTTFRCDAADFVAQCDAIVHRFYPNGYPPELRLRPISRATWDEDVPVVHRLFSESYAGMSEYMPLSLAAFRELYEDFKHIVEPRYSRLLYWKDEPIAFFVGYHDPFRALIPAKRLAARAPWLAPLASLLAAAGLALNKGPVVAPYVGKSPSAVEVKGAMAVLMREYARNFPLGTREFLAVYVADGSPSLKSLPDSRVALTRYVMYRKRI